MGKDKKGSKVAAPAPTPSVSKPLEATKAGRVTKSLQDSKAVAKEAAKKNLKKLENESKKTKKGKRDPTPESSDDDTSDSSASSDAETHEKGASKALPTPVANGKVDASETEDSESDSEDSASDSDADSDSSGASSSGDDAAPKKGALPKINGAVNGEAVPKVNGNAEATSDGAADSVSDDSSDSSESGSDSDSASDDGSDAKGAAAKHEDARHVEAGADESSDGSSSDGSSDDESDEEEVPVKVEGAAKKRKAEDVIDQTPKKTKVVVDGEEKEAVANLFVGNLSWNIDEEWLARDFEKFGELARVRIITDRDSGRSKGYGYVEFTEVDNAVRALEAKNGSELDGRNIRIDFSLPRPQKTDGFTPQQRSFDRAQRYGDTPKEPSKTIFVGNISFDADESMLSNLFQDFGTITGVRLPTDKETQQLKGYGYVDFTSIEEAKAAFEGLQGADIMGRPVRLDFASERTNNDSPGNGRWTRGAPRGRGGFSDRGGRGGFSDRGRGGFNDRGRGRGGARGGRGGTTNRGGFGDFSGKKISF